MSERARPPFRADHVGSLLRPPALAQARTAFADGRITARELRAAEDDAIRDAVSAQREAGLRSVTDGEMRRRSWHMDFIAQIEGTATGSDPSGDGSWRNEHGSVGAASPTVEFPGRLRLREPIFAADFAFLRDIAGDATAKLTIPSPNMVHFRAGRTAIADGAHASEEELWADLTDVYRRQVRALADLGCRYLQFDDTSLAYLNDPRQRARIAAQGRDDRHQHEEYIRRLNAVLEARPPEMAVTTHLCRGNFRSSWFAEGGYDFVAEALFGDLDVDGFFLEYDDERSGGFEPLRFVPAGKVVVLGLITTKRGELERKDDVLRRIEEASRFVGVEQLCVSPQCGFASDAEGNALTPEQQFAKLQLAVEVADEVWG